MAEFTAADKLNCLERELRFRRVVYQRRIANGSMNKEQADREIACMEAVADDYRETGSNQ